jgi:hypothetical protein
VRPTATEEQPEPVGRWWRVRVTVLTEPYNAAEALPRVEKRIRILRVRVVLRLTGDGGAVAASLVLSAHTAGAATDEAFAVLRDACASEGLSVVGLHEAVVTPGEEDGFWWGGVEP